MSSYNPTIGDLVMYDALKGTANYQLLGMITEIGEQDLSHRGVLVTSYNIRWLKRGVESRYEFTQVNKFRKVYLNYRKSI